MNSTTTYFRRLIALGFCACGGAGLFAEPTAGGEKTPEPVAVVRAGGVVGAPAFALLRPESFARHVEYFNGMENEPVVNLVPNAQAWPWLVANIPLFECSDAEVEEIYYFRWWSLRKHLRLAPDGRHVFTEFLTKARPVSSALGLHLREMRWLRDQAVVDEYVAYWLRGNAGKAQEHLHKYSGWLAQAEYERFLVTGDRAALLANFDDLVADHLQWEKERQLPDGLFYQYDVRDAMEESISGSRTKKNVRPTINSYLFGNAQALSRIATLKNDGVLATTFQEKAAAFKRLTLAALWDADATFFKVRLEDGGFSNAREAIGFIPWYFELPEKNAGYEAAWSQFKDDTGFRAPYGIATAERRHPQFRSHGTGTCEWDGAVWPYATSQTLVALANVLRDYPLPRPAVVTVQDYFDAFRTYVKSHRYDGLPYIGEYLDETNGQWLKGRNERSRYYNHSTFADLVIGGVVGLRPRADDVIEVYPLLPDKTWNWFCVDGVSYHGRSLTIFWDRDGTRYGRGKGLCVLVDGRELVRGETLAPLTASLSALSGKP